MWSTVRIAEPLRSQNADAGGLMQSVGYIDFQEMAARCELAHDELHELLEYDVLPVLHVNSQGLCFPISCLEWAQKAAKIRVDYALDLFATALVMRYLHRITELERSNTQLRILLRSAGVTLGNGPEHRT
jgi:hypothetical protein